MKSLIKQYWFWAWLFTMLFLPFEVFAYDGYATVGRGKYFYSAQGSILDTNWYSLTNYSFNDEILSFPSGYTYFINGAEYVAAINFNGEQSFTGSVLIPVVIRDEGGGNYSNLVSQSNFHIGIDSNFGVYNVNPNITRFDSNCGTTIRQSQTQIVYTYCQYFVEFNFVLASPVYGAKNLNFGIYSNSPSQLILSTQDNVFYQSFPLNVWSTSLGLNPNFYLVDNYNNGSGGNSSTDLTNVENKLDSANDKLDDMNDKLDDTNDKLDTSNEKLDDINDSLTDDSFDSQQAEDFFDDFEFYDDSSLADVILAPLDFIDTLTNPCSSLHLNVFQQDVPLKCGTEIFWNRQDVSTFRIFWNTLFGGLIIYRLLLKLFKVVSNALDPTKDDIKGVEV